MRPAGTDEPSRPPSRASDCEGVLRPEPAVAALLLEAQEGVARELALRSGRGGIGSVGACVAGDREPRANRESASHAAVLAAMLWTSTVSPRDGDVHRRTDRRSPLA